MSDKVLKPLNEEPPAPQPEPTNPSDPNPEPTPPIAPTPQPPPVDVVPRSEFEAALKRARQEEKTKAYDRINALQAEMEKLQTETQNKEAQISELRKNMEAIEKASNEKGVDVKALIEQVTTNVSSTFQNKFTDKVTKLESELNDTRANYEKLQIDAYRTDAIAKAGGSEALIPAMVSGNTREAIDASILRAKEEYDNLQKRILAQNLPAAPIEQNRNNAIPGASAPPPINPGGSTGGGSGVQPSLSNTLNSVKTMTPEEYREQREKLLKNVGNRYAPSA